MKNHPATAPELPVVAEVPPAFLLDQTPKAYVPLAERPEELQFYPRELWLTIMAAGLDG